MAVRNSSVLIRLRVLPAGLVVSDLPAIHSGAFRRARACDRGGDREPEGEEGEENAVNHRVNLTLSR